MSKNNKIILKGLDASVYEHPFDRAALRSLKALPGFDTVANFMLNWTSVKMTFIMMQGSCLHITRESNAELYRQLRQCADILGVTDFPETYTKWGYDINACTTGNRDMTMLIIDSGAVDLMSHDELSFVIGHEMGHIKSGHVLYHTMAQLMASAVSYIPLGEQLLKPIQLGIYYWERMSEFTSDRAGLLTCQNPDAAIDSFIKMAGAPIKSYENLNREAFIKQAEEFNTRFSGLGDSAFRAASIMTADHPWTVYRASELLKWIESGQYEEILNKYAGLPCPHGCGNFLEPGASVCDVCGLPV